MACLRPRAGKRWRDSDGVACSCSTWEGRARLVSSPYFRIFCNSHIVHLGAPDNKVVKAACRELWGPLFPLASAHQLFLHAGPGAWRDAPGDIFCSPSPALNARGLACADQGHTSRCRLSGPITGLSPGQPGPGPCPLTSSITRTPFSSPLFSSLSFSIFALKPRPHTGDLQGLPGLPSSLVPTPAISLCHTCFWACTPSLQLPKAGPQGPPCSAQGTPTARGPLG